MLPTLADEANGVWKGGPAINVQRDRLVRHLRRLECGGAIAEATLKGPLAVDALGMDGVLLVSSNGLPGVEPLTTPFGVTGIAQLRQVAERLAPQADPDADRLGLEVMADGRKLLVTSHRRRVELLGTEPSSIATTIQDEHAEQTLALLDGASSAPIGEAVADFLVQMTPVMNPWAVVIRLGQEGGAVTLETEVTEARMSNVSLAAEPPRQARLHPELAVAVFGTLEDWTDAELLIPDSPNVVGVRHGRFTYVMQQMEVGLDE